MPENPCPTCNAGIVCPVHPELGMQWAGINGPPLPPGTEVPWVAPEDKDACFTDWDAQTADRDADPASEADITIVSEEAAAAAIVADQQRPGTREAFDRVFAMDGEQVGRAAVESARRTRGPGHGRGGPFDPRGCC